MNEHFYLQPAIVSLLDPFGSVISKNALLATVSSFNSVPISADIDCAKSLLHTECLSTTKSGEYSNIWHLYALASAVNRPIRSDKNKRLRPMFHTVIHPRCEKVQPGVSSIVMWSRSSYPHLQGIRGLQTILYHAMTPIPI